MKLSEAYTHFEMHYLLDKDRSAKTISEYRGGLFGRNGFIKIMGDLEINQIGLDHIIAWKLHMRRQGIAAATINHMLSGVRWLLKWLGENEHRVLDWKKVTFDKEEQNKPHTVLTLDEMRKLIDATHSLRDKAIISLFFGTGCRSAEIIGLDREQWEAAVLVNHAEVVQGAEPVWEIYVEGKNGKYRPVCMYQSVKSIVDAYLESRPDRFRPLFISQQNRRIHFNTVGKMLHEASRQAGLTKRVTQHVLRHTYATEMGANGMPMPVLAYNLGHANATTTAKIYTHINALHARRSYAQAHPVKLS